VIKNSELVNLVMVVFRLNKLNERLILLILLSTIISYCKCSSSDIVIEGSKYITEKININYSTGQNNKSAKDKNNKSVEELPPISPVHRLNFLTIIIPFLCLFSVSVVIFMLNLLRAPFLCSLSPGPGNRYTPYINIRSGPPRENIIDQDEADDDVVDYLTN
jgi:hypothetical protein